MPDRVRHDETGIIGGGDSADEKKAINYCSRFDLDFSQYEVIVLTILR
ncbi:MAG: hypothetical protein KKC46_22125 [Proteobacteria bacterium]|nr:hypothetical protein [Pseudomonadota bacterium]